MSSHFDKFKIPFGIRGVDGELVDVHDVERGIACGCICPSCKAPLNAKKGDVKEWHFAHVSKHGYKNEVAQCDYSFCCHKNDGEKDTGILQDNSSA